MTASPPSRKTAARRRSAKLEANLPIRTLVTDINLIGERTGWDVARRARETVSRSTCDLRHGCGIRRVASQGAQEHPDPKAICAFQIITAIAFARDPAAGSLGRAAPSAKSELTLPLALAILAAEPAAEAELQRCFDQRLR